MAPPDALVIAGAVLAGFVQGVSGFAFALVAAVFWSHGLVPAVSAPLVVICSLAGQLQSIRGTLPHLDLRLAWPMAAGGLAGLPLGIVLLPLVNADTLRLGVGILLCLYSPAMLRLRHLPEVKTGGRWADAAAGAIGGILGGLAGVSGPAPLIWCNLRRWPPHTRRAVFQSFLVVVQAVGLAGYAAAGLLTTQVLGLALWLLPLAMMASFAGGQVYRRLDQAVFARIILMLLGVTGAALVAASLSRA